MNGVWLKAATGLLGEVFLPKKKEMSFFSNQTLPCPLSGTETNTQKPQEIKQKTSQRREGPEGKDGPHDPDGSCATEPIGNH